MSKADAAWMVPFLRDLADYAEEHGLADLHADLEAVIERHGPGLVGGSGMRAPGAPGEVFSWDCAAGLKGGKGKRKSH